MNQVLIDYAIQNVSENILGFKYCTIHVGAIGHNHEKRFH